jgi:hypothetical protein
LYLCRLLMVEYYSPASTILFYYSLLVLKYGGASEVTKCKQSAGCGAVREIGMIKLGNPPLAGRIVADRKCAVLLRDRHWSVFGEPSRVRQFLLQLTLHKTMPTGPSSFAVELYSFC